MVNRFCECCRKPIKVREADVRRGWGRFCSKSCKARVQEARTGQHADYRARKEDRDFITDQDDPSWGEHEMWDATGGRE